MKEIFGTPKGQTRYPCVPTNCAKRLMSCPFCSPLLSFNSEPSEWDRRVFQTTSGLLDHTDFVWTLGDLQPATTYVMQAKVLSRRFENILQSNIIEFRTRDAPKRESIGREEALLLQWWKNATRRVSYSSC